MFAPVYESDSQIPGGTGEIAEGSKPIENGWPETSKPETGDHKRKRRRRRKNRTSKAREMPSKDKVSDEGSPTPEFAHIRVIRNPDTVDSATQPHPSQPTFRNTSLSLDTQNMLGEDPFSTNKSPTPGDSLASHPSGVTFAARARAAELQAARSRRELNSRETEEAPHETMKFKSKASRTKWQPLDLSTLPDPARESESQSPTPTRMTEASESREELQAAAGNIQKAYTQEEHALSDENRALTEALAPSQLTFAEMLKTDQEREASQIDSTERKIRDRATVQRPANAEEEIGPIAPSLSHGSGKENVALPRQGLARMPSLEPVPVLTSHTDSKWELQRSQLLIERQEKQIADLTEQLRISSMENQQTNSELSTARQLPNTSQPEPFDRQFDESIRPFAQRQYPAVKGTLENTMRPTLSGVNPPPGFNSTPTPGASSGISVPPGFGNTVLGNRQTSYTQHHLHNFPNIAEENPNSRHTIEANIQDKSFDRRDLLAASDPLPWKDRRVPIAIDRMPYYQTYGYPTKPQTPARTEAYTNLDSLPSTSPVKKSREEEVEDWWNMDNRKDLNMKAEIDDYFAFLEAKRVAQSRSDRAALRAANFSDERSSEASSAAVPLADAATATTNKDGKKSTMKEQIDEDREHAELRNMLVDVFHNLKAYKDGPRDYFSQWAPPPSWAIDHTPQGNQSFFSQDWGIPPPRVGRDPRYRAVQHDGRSSVFEDPTGKRPREEYNRQWAW